MIALWRHELKTSNFLGRIAALWGMTLSAAILLPVVASVISVLTNYLILNGFVCGYIALCIFVMVALLDRLVLLDVNDPREFFVLMMAGLLMGFSAPIQMTGMAIVCLINSETACRLFATLPIFLLQIMGRIGDARIYERLTLLFESHDAYVRDASVYAFSGVKDARAIMWLAGSLIHDQEQVRVAAVQALGITGSALGVTRLTEALLDSSEQVREAAEAALQQVNTQTKIWQQGSDSVAYKPSNAAKSSSHGVTNTHLETLQIARREFIWAGASVSLGAVIIAGMSLARKYSAKSISGKSQGHAWQPSYATEPSDLATAKEATAVGSVLSFISGQGTLLLVPFPTLRPVSSAVNLLGGLCSAIGANLAYEQYMHSGTAQLPTPTFEPGQGVSADQHDLLCNYAHDHKWTVVGGVQYLDGDQKILEQFQDSVRERHRAMGGVFASPVFMAKNEMTGQKYVFQFKDDVHVNRQGTGELIVNDNGHVYIHGYGNQALLCRIRILQYLLQEDTVGWTVLDDTQTVEKCSFPGCGCSLLLQDFINRDRIGGKLLKIELIFAPRNDPRWEAHRHHSQNDSGMRPTIPTALK